VLGKMLSARGGMALGRRHAAPVVRARMRLLSGCAGGTGTGEVEVEKMSLRLGVRDMCLVVERERPNWRPQPLIPQLRCANGL